MARNQYLVGQAAAAMEAFKLECATELGIANYAGVDKGDLPSRINGAVGGEMVKRMIAVAEQTIAGGGISATAFGGRTVGNQIGLH